MVWYGIIWYGIASYHIHHRPAQTQAGGGTPLLYSTLLVLMAMHSYSYFIAAGDEPRIDHQARAGPRGKGNRLEAKIKYKSVYADGVMKRNNGNN